MTHRSRPLAHATLRPLVRAIAVGVFVTLVAGLSPGYADTPSAWPDSPHVSVLHALVILFLIPLGLALVISLLAALPSLIKGDSYAPGQPWVGEGEWFGGPRQPVDSDEPEALESAGDQGGAGAKF